MLACQSCAMTSCTVHQHTADGGLESPDMGDGELEVTAEGILCFFSELHIELSHFVRK